MRVATPELPPPVAPSLPPPATSPPAVSPTIPASAVVHNGKIQKFVKTTTYGPVITLDVHSGDILRAVQQQIVDKEGTPLHRQRLYFNGKQLEDGLLLTDYGIHRGSSLHLLRRKELQPPPPRIAVTCSHYPARISSTFHVSISECAPFRFDPSAFIQVSRIAHGGSEQAVAVPGRVEVECDTKSGDASRPSLQLVLTPTRSLGSGLQLGDMVHVQLQRDPVSGLHDAERLIRFRVPTLSSILLYARFVNRLPLTLLVLRLDRHSRDTLLELRMAVAVEADVTLDDVVSISCRSLPLQSSYDVADLLDGDLLTATLTPPAAQRDEVKAEHADQSAT